MSIYDQDTDPSSPEARRETPATGKAADGAGPRTQQSPRAATTDPGVGPPSPPSGGRASPVVVPPASGRGTPASDSTQGRPKDSVELLLEGIGGPRADRTKTMPQTAGEASAAYHAEHAVHAGRSAREEDQKVLVDTVRLPAAAEEPELALLPLANPTLVIPARLGPRVVVAAIAGLLVVLAIFAYLDRDPTPHAAGPGPTVQPAPSEPAPAVPAAPATPAQATGAAEPEAPAGPATAPPTDTPATPPSAVATRPRGSGPRRQAPGEVGEFKTTF